MQSGREHGQAGGGGREEVHLLLGATRDLPLTHTPLGQPTPPTTQHQNTLWHRPDAGPGPQYSGRLQEFTHPSGPRLRPACNVLLHTRPAHLPSSSLSPSPLPPLLQPHQRRNPRSPSLPVSPQHWRLPTGPPPFRSCLCEGSKGIRWAGYFKC